jgi:hypothetical protein
MDLSSKHLIYIIGSPRSGTTMLQVLLGSHPQVATTVELTLFTKYIGPWLEMYQTEVANRVKYGWNQGLPMLWSPEENDEFMRDFLRGVYEKVDQARPGRTHLLDKCPGYSLYVPEIKRLLPHVRFIHLIRDGRDVACSLAAAKETMHFGMNRLAEGGTLWRNWVRGARRAAEYAGDYLELRYEDFLVQGVDVYERVLAFCGLPADRAWIEQTLAENTFSKMKERRATADPEVMTSTDHYRQGKVGSWRKDFTPQDRYEFDRAAGELLIELGYAERGWWAENGAERQLEPRRHELRRRWDFLRRAAKYAGGALLGGKPKP